MLGCENMVSAATAHEAAPASSASNPANAANVVVAADACAAMHAHGCCAKRGTQSVAKARANSSAAPIAKSNKTVANSSAKAMNHTPADGTVVDAALAAPFSTMMDCPLAVNATAALSKARPDESGGDLLPARADDSFSYFKEQLTALTPPSLLPNRGHTYLRCCVFLI